MEYYKSRLTEKEKTYYETILYAFKNHSGRAEPPFPTDRRQMETCVQAVQFDHPELFYVDFSIITCQRTGNRVEYVPKYRYDPEETGRRQAVLEQETERILAGLKRAGARSIYQKCGWLHNWLVKHCVYDDTALERPKERKEAFTIEGVFREHAAVCQGISLAYEYLCRRAGIDAVFVRGGSLRPGSRRFEPHAWNLICAGGAAAHVDVTWDLCMSSGTDGVRYDYFFLPDPEMMRDHQYAGYPVCAPLKSSYFERAGRQFSGLSELEAYVRKEYNRAGQKGQKLHLHFKMKDRKLSEKEIREAVLGQLQNLTWRDFTYLYSWNDTQWVFDYCFTME